MKLFWLRFNTVSSEKRSKIECGRNPEASGRAEGLGKEKAVRKGCESIDTTTRKILNDVDSLWWESSSYICRRADSSMLFAFTLAARQPRHMQVRTQQAIYVCISNMSRQILIFAFVKSADKLRTTKLACETIIGQIKLRQPTQVAEITRQWSCTCVELT